MPVVPQKRSSTLDPHFEFSEEIWVVSIINTGEGLSGHFFGHSVLLIEGLKKTQNSLFPELYIGQFDITASTDESAFTINKKGYIDTVRMFESSNYARNYQGLSFCSYYVTPSEASKMIDAIRKDQADVNENNKKIPFELMQFSLNDQSYNCTSWCYEKLQLIGIDITGKPKPKAPSCQIV